MVSPVDKQQIDGLSKLVGSDLHLLNYNPAHIAVECSMTCVHTKMNSINN